MDVAGLSASVYRSTSDDFATRQPITTEDLPVRGRRFEFVDTRVEPGVTYYYWVVMVDAENRAIVSGPVSASIPGAFSFWPHPHPIPRGRGRSSPIASAHARRRREPPTSRSRSTTSRVARCARW